MDATDIPKYLTASAFARRTGLPVGWVRRELRAGRLPNIRAGRTRFVLTDEAEAQLAHRAEGDAKELANDR